MWAGIAAARVGERRILELVDRSTASRRSSPRCDHFMDYGEQVSRRALAGPAEGHVHARGGAGQRRRLQRSPSRSPTTSSSSTCATTPTRTTGPNNAWRDGSMVAAQMVFMNITEPHASANAGHFRPLKLLTRPGLRLRREPAGRVRDLLRGRGPALRPDLALPRAASRRPPAGRQLRLDLRHVHRRPAPGHGPPLHDRRAAGRRLGRLVARATATARSSAASTATRSTARPRSPRPATACTSTSSR